MSPQLLFFDLDDTLVDHTSAEEAAQRETYECFRAQLQGASFDVWLSVYRKGNLALWGAYGRGEIDRHALSRRRFEEPLTELACDAALAPDVSAFYLAAYARHWRLVEGAEEILAASAERGEVGILSNGLKEIQRAKLERFRLERWVKHVILSEEVGAMKPSREIFDAALRAAGGTASRKMYVGDSFAIDVLGAKNAGWFPVLFNPGGHPLPAPVLYVTRLVDLKPLLE